MDVEILKKALRELVEKEPAFFRDLMLEALRSDGRAAEALLDLFTKHPEAKLRLAQAMAETIAIPLNVATKDDLKQLATKQDIKRLEDTMATKEDLKQFATKDDLKQLATKQDLEELKKWAEEKFATKQDLETTVEQLKRWAEEKFVTKEDLKQYATKQDLETAVEQLRAEIRRIENRMATKDQIESITISVEDSGREMVQYLLEQRGYRCAAERLRLDSNYEFDIYCNAGVLTAVGEARVRTGGRDVEKALERAQELLRRQPDKISGKLVPVFYTLLAEPPAVQKAKELKIWLIESRREVVTLEEVLGTDNKQ